MTEPRMVPILAVPFAAVIHTTLSIAFAISSRAAAFRSGWLRISSPLGLAAYRTYRLGQIRKDVAFWSRNRSP